MGGMTWVQLSQPDSFVLLPRIVYGLKVTEKYHSHRPIHDMASPAWADPEEGWGARGPDPHLGNAKPSFLLLEVNNMCIMASKFIILDLKVIISFAHFSGERMAKLSGKVSVYCLLRAYNRFF